MMTGETQDRILLVRAAAFAERAHRGVSRTHTGEPYIIHPLEVAEMIASLGYGAEVIAAALLHDTVEDNPIITFEIIKASFGALVAKLVREVSEVSVESDGDRSIRKNKDHQHFASASEEGQTIKLADSIANMRSIMSHNPKFAKKYMPEKKQLVSMLTQGHPALRKIAEGMIEAWEVLHPPFYAIVHPQAIVPKAPDVD
jgi:(p)ppGpp synthase/HD superfamily hydrolase